MLFAIKNVDIMQNPTKYEQSYRLSLFKRFVRGNNFTF